MPDVARVAWVPDGLGTIEAALAATLLARGFTFWLPMAPGLTIARREMMDRPASAA
jgi:hypothetical protein